MATATPPGRPAQLPAPPAQDDDWPAMAAGKIEQVVGTVRDKTTGPALTVARGVVYGTFAVIVGGVCLVMFIIALLRLVDSYLPDAVFGEDHMWASYLIVGAAFTIVGLVLWGRRRPREEAVTP